MTTPNTDPLAAVIRACDELIEEAEANADFDQTPDGTGQGWTTVDWGYVRELIEAVQVYRIKSHRKEATDE